MKKIKTEENLDYCYLDLIMIKINHFPQVAFLYNQNPKFSHVYGLVVCLHFLEHIGDKAIERPNN